MTKRLMLAALSFMALAPAANAQLQKGNVLVGGDIGEIRLGLNNGNPFSIAIQPKAALFIEDNIAVGGEVDLGLSTGTGVTTTTYGISALGRYYINDKKTNILKHGRFFGEATLGIAGQNYSGGLGSTNGLGLTFGPGYAYFITPNIGLEALLKYELKAGFGSAPTNSDLDLKFGFQIYLPHRQLKKIVHEESAE